MSITGCEPQVVFDGRCHHPQLDEATDDLSHEIASTLSVIPANSITTTTTQQDWQTYWKQADEQTLSSESGLHFGHYKAAINLEYISHYHVAETTVALTLGQPFDRWKRGVTVMLEKERRVNLVSKLCAILLMEADFNTSNNIIFGNRMLYSIQKHAMMLEEILVRKVEQQWMECWLKFYSMTSPGNLGNRQQPLLMPKTISTESVMLWQAWSSNQQGSQLWQ